MQSMPPLELIMRSFNRLAPHFNTATGEFHSNHRSEYTIKRDECQADVIGNIVLHGKTYAKNSILQVKLMSEYDRQDTQ